MTNPTVPILPNRIPWKQGPLIEEEFKRILKIRRKKVFSLDKTQLRILADVVFPYWQNYLKAIVHPFDLAYITSLQFGWADEVISRDPDVTRVAYVSARSYVSVNMLPENILFQIELCHQNVPHHCIILHEGRGGFDIPLRDELCDGIKH
jgi:hypothetical protein